MSTSQMQIVIKLLQVCEHQATAVCSHQVKTGLLFSSGSLQTVNNKPVALFSTALLQAALINLVLARGHPAATGRWHQVCCGLTYSSGLMQPVISLRQPGKFLNLQQVCDICGHVDATLSYDPKSLWKPWVHKERVKVAKKVESFKCLLQKKALSAKK